jgi:hypothetical protein
MKHAAGMYMRLKSGREVPRINNSATLTMRAAEPARAYREVLVFGV